MKAIVFVWLRYSPDEDLHFAELCDRNGHDIDTSGKCTTYGTQEQLVKALNTLASTEQYHLTMMN